jgi:ABC-2 type transport system permease protein
MRTLRLIRTFILASALEETAYAANFTISVFYSLLNFATGWLGLFIVFGQVGSIGGWDYDAALAVLGVYLLVEAVSSLVISPSLERLGGMDGDIWRGTFDFVLLRPMDTQLFASLRQWRLLSLFDLLLGILVLGVATRRLAPGPEQWMTFVLTLGAGLLVLYALLLFLTSLVFWSPGFLFTWIFYGIFQMGRYPVGIYPGFLRPILTWVIPIGVMTTIPAQALAGDLPPWLLAAAVAFALGAFALASLSFRRAIGRYASASS